MRIEAYFWEEQPMRATRGDFQAQIAEPAEFDLVVCILWSRLGSRLHPGKHRRNDGSPFSSGTEYEFESAAQAFAQRGRPDLLVYRRTETPFFPPEPSGEMEARLSQWKALDGFCRRWFLDEETETFRAAFNQYRNLAEFEDKLESHLLSLAREFFARAGGEAASAPLGAQIPTWTQGSPYRGLHSFDFEHEPIFFGRTKARDEVLGVLRARWEEERCAFVLLFGASGSGKSSLLRAGVLPWLVRPGVIEGVGLWRCLVFRPSDTPTGRDLLDGLSRALLLPAALPELGADASDADALAAMLRQRPEDAVILLETALARGAAETQRAEDLPRQPVARLALGLDQLEEVFTAAERFSVESRALFFRALDALARSGIVWILAALRSDFYMRCEEVPLLVALKQGRGQYHLLAPGAVELGQMIRLPAEAAGVVFEEHAEKGRLEDVIRDEALAEPGALPLLEYALDELYRAGATRGRLTHEDHAKLGGVAAALARRAEETYAALSAWAQGALESVLRQIVRLGEGEEDVAARRTAGYAAATAAAGAGELVERFLDARLLVGDRDAVGARTVTVAHESLLRIWPRAVAWVRENRDFLRVRARLGTALARWEEGAQHRDFLLPAGRPLAEAEELLTQNGSALESGEVRFIESSLAAAHERTLRERKRARRVLTAISTLLLLALGGGAFSASQYRKADASAERALALTREASRSDLAVAVDLVAKNRRAEAIAYLGRSLRFDPGNRRAADWFWLEATRGGAENFPAATVFHDGPVYSAAFSADGTRLVTASYDQTARVWEAHSGRPVGEPMRHGALIREATFSPDGTRVLTASGDGTARVWEAATGEPLGKPLPHEGSLRSAAFSPDGTRVVTASIDRTARIWDAASGRPLGGPLRHGGVVYGAAFSPDGKLIVTASQDHTAQLWDAVTGAAVGAPLRHESDVLGATFSADGIRVATASADGTARIWEVATSEPAGEPMRHEKPVISAHFSPDGTRLVTASEDQTARVWDAGSGRSVGEPMRHGGPIRSARFSADGTRLVTASEDGSARIWEATTGQSLGEPLRHEGIVYAAALSADGLRVVTASADRTARVWDAATGQAVGVAFRHRSGVNTAALSADGARVVTASEDMTARLWEVATGRPVGEPMRQNDRVLSAAFRPDGKQVVTASWDGHVQVWNAATGQPVGPSMLHVGPVRSAAFSADGTLIVTATRDQSAGVWVAATGRPLGAELRHGDFVLKAEDGWVWTAAFNADATRVVTASEDQTARIWEATGQPVGEPMRHDGAVRSALFSPKGTLVVTGSADRTARLWEAATGRSVGGPMRHEGVVNAVAFSSDGSRVVTASADKTARLWDAATGQPLGEPMRHGDQVWSAAFSADGTRVVTASLDHTARVWEAGTGQPVGEPLRHLGVLRGATFSADGSRVVTASADGTARVWRLPPELSLAPAYVAELAGVLAGWDFGPAGEIRETPIARRIQERNELRRRLLADPVVPANSWGRLALWALSGASDRTVSPEDETTLAALGGRKRAVGTQAELRETLGFYPQDPLLRISLAYFESEAKRAAFLREYDVARLPPDCALCLEAHAALREQRAWGQALRAAQNAIAAEPKSNEARRALGQSLYEMQRYSESAAAFALLLPDSRNLEDLSMGMLCAGQLQDAAQVEALAARAGQISPQNATLHFRLGLALNSLGKPAEAIEAFQRALRFASATAHPPGEDDILCGVALAQWWSGARPAAIATANRLVRRNSAYAEPRHFLESAVFASWPPGDRNALQEIFDETMRDEPARARP